MSYGNPGMQKRKSHRLNVPKHTGIREPSLYLPKLFSDIMEKATVQQFHFCMKATSHF